MNKAKHIFYKLCRIIFFSSLCCTPYCAFAIDKQEYTSKIIIFVSFSMTNESLKGWLDQANKVGASVIIRGLVDNSFVKTQKKLLEVLPNKRGGIQIDPMLFKKFNIQKVPAVVLTNPECKAETFCQEYNVIYGNVNLHYALEKMKSKDDHYEVIINNALEKLSR